jgi:hypothetical protein
MVIDHIAWKWFPVETLTGQAMHFIGRIAGPSMAFFLVEGYVHTSDRLKYAKRLGVFAFISWIPCSLFEKGSWPTLSMGVMYTLFLGFLALSVWDRQDLQKGIKITLIVIICFLSMIGDWPIFDVLWPLFLYIYRDNPKKKWIIFIFLIVVEVAICVGYSGIKQEFFQFGAFLVPPIFILFYNGEPGSRKPFHKWFFYVFYPLHILIIYLIKTFIS